MNRRQCLKAIALLLAATAVTFAEPDKSDFSTGNFGKPTTVLPSGLGYRILKEGSGEVAASGTHVIVHYTGYLKSGKVFDSSVTRGQTFDFNLGAGEVIPGWDIGVAGMKKGEKRLLFIPSRLAYGSRGAGGDIPPNTDLYFVVEYFGKK